MIYHPPKSRLTTQAGFFITNHTGKETSNWHPYCSNTASLEENLDKLRLQHPVTVSAVSEDESRNTYSLVKLEPLAPVVEESTPENVAQTIASVGPFFQDYQEIKKDYKSILELYERALMRLNRRIPNGTYGGVRGRLG